MKSVFIISSYPSTDKKIKILKESLRSIKDVGFDILLTTNYPIKDQEIYELVDYIVYDKTDIQNFHDFGIFDLDAGWYSVGANFTCTIQFNNAYHFDLYRSIYNGVSLANNLGYDYFNYMEGDCILLNKSLVTDIKNKLILEEKKLFFVECLIKEKFEYKTYGTHFFGGYSKYFIENSKIPFDLNEWVKEPFLYQNSMEVIFYEKFKHVVNNILIIPHYSSNDIIINKIKKIEDYGLKNLLFFDNETPYLFFTNYDQNDVNIKLYLDDNLFRNYVLKNNHYNIEQINIDTFLNKKIRLELIIDGNIEIINKILNEKTIDNIKKTQKIVFS